MQRRTGALIPLSLIALSLGAMLPGTAHPLRAAGYTIAFLPKAVGNPYFDTAFAGAKLAAKEHGDTVLQVGPATADASGQVTFIKTLIQQHVNAIAVSADDPGGDRARPPAGGGQGDQGGDLRLRHPARRPIYLHQSGPDRGHRAGGDPDHRPRAEATPARSRSSAAPPRPPTRTPGSAS